MLNEQKINVVMHLWYEETSLFLIDKLSKVWSGEVHVSLIRGSESNETLIRKMKEKFAEVHTYELSQNFGNDQIGFWKIFRKIKNKKQWTLYLHDKHPDKIEWINDIVDPLINNAKIINKMIEEDNDFGESKYGIISSGHKQRMVKILTESCLVEIDKNTPKEDKLEIVLSRQTLVWLRELQYILYNEYGLIEKEQLNFYFTSGTMFVINTEVAEMAHACVCENFFPECYRKDGDVTHALERFYYYVSLCSGRKNEFIT